MAQEKKYEDALEELETIVSQLENDELAIDEMATKLKRAQQLIKLCNAKLTKAENEIKSIIDNG